MVNQKNQKKRKAYFWGHVAEYISELVLIFKGYKILARRFKCKSGEIDLIARKGNYRCFIEVKARQSTQLALEALSIKQKKRISKAAEWYFVQFNERQKRGAEGVFCRFDLIAVEPWALPTHVKDAWQMDIIK